MTDKKVLIKLEVAEALLTEMTLGITGEAPCMVATRGFRHP